MNDALVSVIIPVYNLEDYIENCLNSIINQTYKNLEIICVDDGSEDSSSEKIKAMAEKDKRIVLIQQKNAGVSAARNVGMRNSHGEYLVFVDGDDYIHYQAIEILLDCAEKSGSNMICAYEIITNVLNEKMYEIPKYTFKYTEYKDMFINADGSFLGKSACAKLIKREIALASEFPQDITSGEDGYYIISLLSRGAKVAVVDERLYYYYKRENSTVTSKFSIKKFSITKSFDRICEKLKTSDNEFLKSYSLQYLYQTILYNRTMAIGTEDEKIILDECKRIGKKWMKAFIKEKGISVKIKIMFLTFFYSRQIYELARQIQDPTMRDFYKSRKRKDESV
jgi:glycosyltransferase involved in cell wall biosynthesis